jgi:hypothetical protein
MTGRIILVGGLCFLLAGCTEGQPRQSQEYVTKDHTETFATWVEHPIGLARTARVDYNFFERNGQSVNVCIIARSERQFWRDGQSTRGYACNGNLSSGSDHATLDAGDYYLAFYCPSRQQPCIVTYSILLTG